MKLTGFFTRALTVVGLLTLGTVSTQAGTLNLSTGLDASNTLITLGNTLDAHWTVDQFSGGTAPAKVVDATNADSGFPYWSPNGPNSSWITIDPNTTHNDPFALVAYSYYRTFNLTASEVATAAISGVWGIDDGGNLKLNGNTLSSVPNDYSATTSFSAAAGSGLFVAGVNTLKITMTSSDNFLEAVRLEGTLTGVSSVPEPSTLLLAICGLPLALVARRRRLRSAA